MYEPAPPSLLRIGRRIPAGRFPLHSRFRRYGNFLHAGPEGARVVGVTEEPDGASPYSLVVSSLALPERGELVVTADSVELSGTRLARNPGQLYDACPAVAACRPEVFAAQLAALIRQIAAEAPPASMAFVLEPALRSGFAGGFARALLARLEEGVALLETGEWAAGARTLRGCGSGLTPTGDDFLAGVLYALRLDELVTGADRAGERESVRENALGGSVFSNTMLDMAARGEPFAGLKRLLEKLAGQERLPLAKDTQRMLSLGHTSGADLLSGLAWTCGRLATASRIP